MNKVAASVTTVLVVTVFALVGFTWVTERRGVKAPPSLVYEVPLDKLDETIRSKWVQLSVDEETKAFVDSCQPNPFRVWLATMLRKVMSRMDANGIAGRGQMFVLSRAQMLSLVPRMTQSGGEALSLLDIGSGDGSIAERFSDVFARVVSTETSWVMARKLRSRGWEVYEPPGQEVPLEHFDVITCFNVLDRADKPLSLLEMMRDRLRPGTGRLVLAVVLPWCPFVLSGTQRLIPSETLDMAGASCRRKVPLQTSLQALVDRVLDKVGLEVVSISRVPYISDGNLRQRYFVLSDYILVCKLRESPVSQTQDVAHEPECNAGTRAGDSGQMAGQAGAKDSAD